MGLRGPRKKGVLKPAKGSLRSLPLAHGDILTMEGHFQMARPRRSPEDRIQRSR